MRYNRTTGLMITQMQELVRRVNEALDEPWNKHIGRPKSLGLYKAVEAACMYLRQNATQEFIGDARDTSQPTISRYTAMRGPIAFLHPTGRPPAIGMVHDVVAAGDPADDEARLLERPHHLAAPDGGNRRHQAMSGTVTVSSSGTPNSANQPSRA